MRYNTSMKVWRGFTLTLWALLLTMCMTFAIVYRSIQTTVLDQRTTTELLRESLVYPTIRNEILAPKVLSSINELQPDNQLLDLPLIRTVLEQTVPDNELEQRLKPAITSLYRWLDSKEPEVTFSLSLADKQTAFYKALEQAVHKKTTSLDSCVNDPYPPEDALLKYRCLPSYLTAKEATQAVMGAARAQNVASTAHLSAEQFELPRGIDVGKAKQTPTYLNMLWAVNWLALAGLGIIPIFLLISRRAVGGITTGIALIIAGLAVLVGIPNIGSLSLTGSSGFAHVGAELVKVVSPKIIQSASLLAIISIAGGAGLVVVGGLWKKSSKGRKKHA